MQTFCRVVIFQYVGLQLLATNLSVVSGAWHDGSVVSHCKCLHNWFKVVFQRALACGCTELKHN